VVLYGVGLLLVFVVALFIRIYFAHDNVFADDWVRFQANDPWFQMRQVDNMLHHFPDRSLFDPFGYFDRGQNVVTPPLFNFVVALTAWVIGLGSPSRDLMEAVGAYFPAIMGALMTVVMFFVGSALFNRRVGLLAAALMAVLPGQYLLRTLLGFTDQHCVEILLSLLFMLFFILAVKSAVSRELTFEHLRCRDWAVLRRPLLLSIAAGVVLGCYLIAWLGGALFVFIIFVFLIVQSVVDHSRGRPVGYLCFVGSITMLVALPIVVGMASQYQRSTDQIAALLIALVAFLVVWAGSAFMAGRKWPRWGFPAALAAALGLGYLLFWVIDPSTLSNVLDRFGLFTPTAARGTIQEVQSLGWDLANLEFTTGRVLAPIALIPLIWIVIKRREPDKVLLLVWTLILFIATWRLSRFGYYSAANVAILVAYLSWLLLRLAGVGEAEEEARRARAPATVARAEDARGKFTRKERRKADKKARKAQRRGSWAERPIWGHIYVVIALLIVFFFGYYYNIDMSVQWARELRGPSDDWHDTLVWMRDNTPPPFEDPDSYYAEYEALKEGERFEYPDTAYGVMSWWDYGYHITYLAERIPNSNPSGQKGAPRAARFFTARDEATGSELLESWGSRYVVINDVMSTGRFLRAGDQELLTEWAFYNMAVIAGENEADFFEIVHTEQGLPVSVYYPEYYETIVSRLYNFKGEAWDPDAWVDEEDPSTKIRAWSFRTGRDSAGNPVKVAADEELFDTYREARAFVDDNPDYRLVGTKPLVSPVPLEGLDNYKLVYESPTIMSKRGDESFSEVAVFEFTPAGDVFPSSETSI